jgi:hypothetical protein
MSTITAPPRLFDLPLAPEREHPTCDRPSPDRSRISDGGRLTLEERLDCAWEGLSAAGVAPCPLCGSRMELADTHEGRCRTCGSTLT